MRRVHIQERRPLTRPCVRQTTRQSPEPPRQIDVGKIEIINHRQPKEQSMKILIVILLAAIFGGCISLEEWEEIEAERRAERRMERKKV